MDTQELIAIGLTAAQRGALRKLVKAQVEKTDGNITTGALVARALKNSKKWTDANWYTDDAIRAYVYLCIEQIGE